MRRVIIPVIIILLFCSAVIFNSCSDDSVTSAPPPPVTDNLFLIGQDYAIGARALVSIYVEETLKVGYNNVYIVLKDSLTGATIEDAHIQFKLTDHGVGTPVENPEETAVDGKFKGAWILNEPQDVDNILHWRDSIFVHNHPPDLEGAGAFGGFRVKENPGKLQYIVMPDSTKLYLAYITPSAPASGLNDFEFIINRDEITQFPADGSYTIQVNPVFTGDNHTTTGNVNPTGNLENGHYKGKINLDHAGSWLINLTVSRNGISRDTYFELSY